LEFDCVCPKISLDTVFVTFKGNLNRKGTLF
jgi:hypothetical protein